MRIGSLFSGAGGLDMAVEHVFGGETVWHSEVDPAASKVLAARWPGVPNFGDVTTIDWDYINLCVENHPDILCGGYPCQPFSAAGQRKGTNDERHLWPYFAEAIRRIRPRYVVLENVAGHRSMGFDSVLADLARIGYDAQWCSVRASDVGAPHRRERIFVLATDNQSGTSGEQEQQHLSAPTQAMQPRERARGGAARRGDAADTTGVGRYEGRPESEGFIGGSDAALSSDGPVNLLPTPNAQDGNGGGRYSSEGHQSTLPGEVRLLPTPLARDSRQTSPGDYARHTPSLAAVDHYLPTPQARDWKGGQSNQADVSDAVRLLCTPSAADGGGGHLNRSGDRADEPLLPGQAREMATAWGKYEPAIRRWEQVTRPAPAPTEPNKNGNPRLSAAFSEWLMGWPAGWVTDLNISRNDQLHIIGNGVVPQQAIAALQWLLTVSEVAA